MYMKKMLEIGAVDNGFVIEVRVPVKSKKESKDSEFLCHPLVEKQYIAKDLAGVTKIVEEIMPLLDKDFSSEDEFDKAFEDAADAV